MCVKSAILTLFRTLPKNPVNGPVGYFWTPEHHEEKYQVCYMLLI